MKTVPSLLRRPSAERHQGFTLVEVLVALGIMSLLLTVILVPLRMGFESFNAGRARSEVQLQAQATIQQVAGDIAKAQLVFPNTFVPGVSNSTASTSTSDCSLPAYPSSWNYLPYIRTTTPTNTDAPFTDGTASPTYGACSSASTNLPWSNPSRIDMLQLRRDSNGDLMNSSAGQDFIVSYYPRRLDVTKPYDIVDNPIVLFRAQYPYRRRYADNTPGGFYPKGPVGTDYNAFIDWTKFPTNIGTCNATNSQSNRSFAWITHNYFGEANLEPLCVDTPSTTAAPPVPATISVIGAHTMVTPRDMGLNAPRAISGGQDSLVPELSFVEESTNGSRINRVTINMTLARYDSNGIIASNGQPAAQRVRVTQTIDVLNAGCSP